MREQEALDPVAPEKKQKRHFILLVLLLAVVFIFAGQLIGFVLMDIVAHLVPNASDSVVFLFDYLAFIGIDALVLLYCAKFEKDIFRSFLSARHGSRGNTGKNFALGLLFGFLLNGCCILVAWLHGDLDFSVGRFDLVYLLAALLCVIVQSGAEELVTRGYMLGALRRRYPVWLAIAANALLFGALHLANPGFTVLSMLEIVCIGLVLSFVVYDLDSIWMAIAIHTAWNFTQNFLFGLPNSGIVSKGSFLHLEAAKDSAFYDVGFGVESTVTAVLVVALFGAAVVLYARKKNRGETEQSIITEERT